jgi:branched-chain amino acid transport system permease protein
MKAEFAKELAWTIAIGVAALLILPLGVDVFTLTVLCIYAMLGLSLGFIWGFGGILCFGQAAFFGLGAYAYAISAINIGSPWGPFFISIIVPALVAAIFGAMLFFGRLNDVYLAVLTLVFTLILYKFMNVTAGEEYVIGTARLGGYNGIPGFETLTLPWDSSEYIYGEMLFYFALGLLLAVYLGLRWLLKSPFGRIMVGVRENELRAELMGYDVRLIKTAVFAIGGGVAGLSGCLYANWAEIVTPNLFSLGQSAETIIWVIVGGAGTLAGPMLGAAILGYLKYLLGQQSLIDNTFVLGAVLILAVLLLPRGVFPTLASLFDRLTGNNRRTRSSGPKPRRRQRRGGGHGR